jgi:gluconolactonase
MTIIFAAPAELQTEVFATLPDNLRAQPPNRPIWGGKERDSFLEGPTFLKDGSLLCVNVPFGQIIGFSAEGVAALGLSYEGEPNGLTCDKNGTLFLCDYRRGILRVDGSKIIPVASHFRSEHFKAVNDLVFASNGDLYFTDQGETDLIDRTGRVYRLSPDGTIDIVIQGLPSPNGLALVEDESVLLIAVTRANAIWRVPLLGGSSGRVGVFIQLTGGIGPDGMAVDTFGRIAVAHLGLGSVWIFDQHGEPQYRIRSCRGRATTNVAFDPRQPSDLYITEAESGSILRCRLPLPD